MEDKNLELKLKAAYFLIGGALSCYYCFGILFFRDRNLNYIQMGIGFATLPLIGVVCQPVWGYVTDEYLNKRKSLIIVMALSALAILLLVFSRSFYSIMTAIILLAMFMTSMNPLLDALCLEVSCEYRGIQFNRVKLMGAIGYSICVALMGVIIKYTNFKTTQDFVDTCEKLLGIDFLSIDENDDEFNHLIKEKTSFNNWNQMIDKATTEWAGKKLGFK